DDVSSPSTNQKKAEVFNILKALNYVREKQKKDVTEAEILNLHKLAMEGLLGNENLGKWRKNMEAIFNSAGIAIYIPPPPKQVPGFIKKLVKYINSPKERLI